MRWCIRTEDGYYHRSLNDWTVTVNNWTDSHHHANFYDSKEKAFEALKDLLSEEILIPFLYKIRVVRRFKRA